MRNIGYLRFGFKIRQGFTGGITSLSPLWISWTGNEGAREGAQLLYLGGSLPPPCRAAGSHPKYKTPPPSLCALIFCPRDPERGEGERRGEGGNSTGEVLPDFGSEPQVTNISRLQGKVQDTLGMFNCYTTYL